MTGNLRTSKLNPIRIAVTLSTLVAIGITASCSHALQFNDDRWVTIPDLISLRVPDNWIVGGPSNDGVAMFAHEGRYPEQFSLVTTRPVSWGDNFSENVTSSERTIHVTVCDCNVEIRKVREADTDKLQELDNSNFAYYITEFSVCGKPVYVTMKVRTDECDPPAGWLAILESARPMCSAPLQTTRRQETRLRR